jgi:hypothetical protein
MPCICAFSISLRQGFGLTRKKGRPVTDLRLGSFGLPCASRSGRALRNSPPSAGQTVLALDPSVSAMLGCVTTGRGQSLTKTFGCAPLSGAFVNGTLEGSKEWI